MCSHCLDISLQECRPQHGWVWLVAFLGVKQQHSQPQEQEGGAGYASNGICVSSVAY